MRKAKGKEAAQMQAYLLKAADIAREATCTRSQCGTIIVSEGGIIIGTGFNNPPAGLESQRRCGYKKSAYHPKVTDKTCCVHAEQRAMIQALSLHAKDVPGSTLYFALIDERGALTCKGNPYCTICSKMALDIGIARFVLYQRDGIVIFDTEEYNDTSFAYRES
jgi:deoxycytidylate deaminase